MPPAKPNIIDYTRLRSFTAGDPQTERELGGLYRITAEALLARLELSLQNPEEWSRNCHSLKGASVNLGIVEVGRLAARGEKALPSIRLLEQLKTASRDAARQLT
jgi:HPt (histidine-containing phosphotransfer) domain-containing protein